MEKLFSYGTLQLEQVQADTFGRTLKGFADVLEGYLLEKIKISNPKVLASSGSKFHPIIQKSQQKNDQVKGRIFEISKKELAQADKYEVEDYQRVEETFKSGTKAWVYIAKKKPKPWTEQYVKTYK